LRTELGTHVSRRENPRVRRAEAIVHLDACFHIVGHACGFEIQALDVRRTSHRHQQLVNGLLVARPVGLDVQEHLIAAPAHFDALSAAEQSHTVPQECFLRNLRCIRFLSRQDAVGSLSKDHF
jgi:hypothetical protein